MQAEYWRGYRESIEEDTGRVLKRIQGEYWRGYKESIGEDTGKILEWILERIQDGAKEKNIVFWKFYYFNNIYQ